jgi:hypothetical protein
MRHAEQITFVTGFQRSGTTVLTEAIAQAVPAPCLTVGDLAQYAPAVAELLASLDERTTPLDRGVDARPLEAGMAEEYNAFLAWRSGLPRSRYGSWARGDLQMLADAVAARGESSGAVMKNPWDTTNEALLLKDFPGSAVVVIRRPLPEIEASMRATWARQAPRHEYRAAGLAELPGGKVLDRMYDFVTGGPRRRAVIGWFTVWQRRVSVLRLARQVRRLPPARTALLSYDEFKADPRTAAHWAAHLLDADVLAAEFVSRSGNFGAVKPGVKGSRIAAAIDRHWERSWQRARAEHAHAREAGSS